MMIASHVDVVSKSGPPVYRKRASYQQLYNA